MLYQLATLNPNKFALIATKLLSECVNRGMNHNEAMVRIELVVNHTDAKKYLPNQRSLDFGD